MWARWGLQGWRWVTNKILVGEALSLLLWWADSVGNSGRPSGGGSWASSWVRSWKASWNSFAGIVPAHHCLVWFASRVSIDDVHWLWSAVILMWFFCDFAVTSLADCSLHPEQVTFSASRWVPMCLYLVRSRYTRVWRKADSNRCTRVLVWAAISSGWAF